MRFDMICDTSGFEHRLTKPNHPWTNGQVERMNRAIEEAAVIRYRYDNHEQLRHPVSLSCSNLSLNLSALHTVRQCRE